MSKKRRNRQLSMPPNIKQLVQHKERERDKEVELIKNALENVQTLAATQSMLNLLTSFVGHDIKNEIHNIDGIISTINVNEISDKEIESIKSCLDNMRAALEDFKNITDDKEKEEFTLNRIISSLMVLHRNNFRRDKILFSVDYVNLDKEFNIKFHFRQFLQLLNNLLINSYKALKEATKKEIKIIITNFGDSLSFKICDTGVGVPIENRDKIFEPYFSTTGGSGVGLTHVQFVLKEMNGKIELINTDPYFNTIFNITIPKS